VKCRAFISRPAITTIRRDAKGTHELEQCAIHFRQNFEETQKNRLAGHPRTTAMICAFKVDFGGSIAVAGMAPIAAIEPSNRGGWIRTDARRVKTILRASWA
jgi:hypothetical protein